MKCDNCTLFIFLSAMCVLFVFSFITTKNAFSYISVKFLLKDGPFHIWFTIFEFNFSYLGVKKLTDLQFKTFFYHGRIVESRER